MRELEGRGGRKREREEREERECVKREERVLGGTATAIFPRYIYTACNVTATPCRPTNMSIVSSTISCKDWRVGWKKCVLIAMKCGGYYMWYFLYGKALKMD